MKLKLGKTLRQAPTGAYVPSLSGLAISPSTFTIGVSVTANILGTNAGSTLTSADIPAQFSLNSAARTISYNGGGSATTATFTLTETLAGATGSPRNTTVSYTLTTAATGAPIPSGNAAFLNSVGGSAVTAPIVGQTYYIDPGPFGNTPTSYDYTIYEAGSAIQSGTFTSSGDTAFLVTDAMVGDTLQVKCHGINGFGTSATTSDSSVTSAVADIDLTNAITAFSRTSSSGDNTATLGLTFSVTFGSNVYQGYTLRATTYSDSGLSTQIQSVGLVLSYDNMQSGASLAADLVAAGFAKMGATDWLTLGIEATSPHGVFHSYSYGTAISPTDAVTAMTWNTTDNNVSLGLSNGNLTAGQGGGLGSARGSRGLSSGKVYWEIKDDFSSANISPAVADSTASLSAYWKAAAFGGTQTAHAAEYSGSDSAIYYDAGQTSAAAIAQNDIVGVALDATNKKVWFAKNNTWQNGDPAAGTGGLSLTGISTPIYPAVQLHDGAIATANFGATAFTYTPPTGFSAP